MPNRPQPAFPEPNTQEYWDGVKAGELRSTNGTGLYIAARSKALPASLRIPTGGQGNSLPTCLRSWPSLASGPARAPSPN